MPEVAGSGPCLPGQLKYLKSHRLAVFYSPSFGSTTAAAVSSADAAA
jgi:hypothetical protein